MTRLLVSAGVAALLSSVTAFAEPRTPVPTPIGGGPLFHPAASNASVDRADRIASLHCDSRKLPRAGVHLELFARGRVVIVPAGIGVRPPLRRRGAYVLGGSCSYPVRTREPTGVIEIARAVQATLGDFFDVWGRPLTRQTLVGFHSAAGERVRAFVNGRRWGGDPRAIPLVRHAQIVLQLGAHIPPHPSYRFPRGL